MSLIYYGSGAPCIPNTTRERHHCGDVDLHVSFGHAWGGGVCMGGVSFPIQKSKTISIHKFKSTNLRSGMHRLRFWFHVGLPQKRRYVQISVQILYIFQLSQVTK